MNPAPWCGITRRPAASRAAARRRSSATRVIRRCAKRAEAPRTAQAPTHIVRRVVRTGERHARDAARLRRAFRPPARSAQGNVFASGHEATACRWYRWNFSPGTAAPEGSPSDLQRPRTRSAGARERAQRSRRRRRYDRRCSARRGAASRSAREHRRAPWRDGAPMPTASARVKCSPILRIAESATTARGSAPRLHRCAGDAGRRDVVSSASTPPPRDRAASPARHEPASVRVRAAGRSPRASAAAPKRLPRCALPVAPPRRSRAAPTSALPPRRAAPRSPGARADERIVAHPVVVLARARPCSPSRAPAGGA